MSHPYARDGSRWRPFGGINIIFAGDLWQLPPVRDIPIFANPYAAGHEIEVQRILKMFWRKESRAGHSNADSIQRSFSQTESKRTKDEWLQAVLTQNRNGCEEWEVYCFTHGLPTRNVGTWLPSQAFPSCGNALCASLAKTWALQRKRGFTWEARQSAECAVCKTERERRCRVMYPGVANDGKHMQEPFEHAPYIHP